MREDLHKIGEGNTADIYMIDGDKVVKLFKFGYSQNAVWQEYQNHSMVNRIMNNVPQIYEYIEENERFGYIMENVQGKSLASLIVKPQTVPDDYCTLFLTQRGCGRNYIPGRTERRGRIVICLL